jgi:hypothetical protein
MRIAISWWQMAVGVSYPLLGQTDKVIPFDAPHWLSSIRVFLQSVESSIHIEGLTLPQPHRESDPCIMDVIHDLPGLTSPQLSAYNRCRVFLGVHFLSEIVTADGHNLARDTWEGRRERISTSLWPYQSLPGPKSFRTWRRLFAPAFLQGHLRRVSRRTNNLTLRSSLGRWHPSSEKFRSHWSSFYAASNNQLFLLSDDDARTFNAYPSCPICRRPKHPARAFSDTSACMITTLPLDSAPVDYWAEPNKYVIPATNSSLLPTPPVPPRPSRWSNYIQTLPTWEQELLSSVTVVDRRRLFSALHSAEVIFLASDGGATDKLGSYGALMATQEHILIECGGRA